MRENQKGITLIALIITIIVMLILVAVTINVALNGGIFNKASKAAIDTQREVDREELIGAMIGAYNSAGNFDKDLVGELPSGAKWCRKGDETYENTPSDIEPTGGGDYVITKNNNKFYIDSDGAVYDEKPQNVWEKNGLTSEYVKFGKKYTLPENRTAYVIFGNDGSFTSEQDDASPSDVKNYFDDGTFDIIDDNIFINFGNGSSCSAFYFDYDENTEKYTVTFYNDGGHIENVKQLSDENLKNAIINENYKLLTFEYVENT